jgi:hypothetical protein
MYPADPHGARGVGPGYADPRSAIDAAVAMRDTVRRSSASAFMTLPHLLGASRAWPIPRYSRAQRASSGLALSADEIMGDPSGRVC